MNNEYRDFNDGEEEVADLLTDDSEYTTRLATTRLTTNKWRTK